MDRAHELKLKAERDAAEAEGRAYAVEEKLPFYANVGAPMPTFLHGEFYTHLVYYLNAYDEEVGRITFKNCAAVRTDQQGEDGHILLGSGWEPYTFLRIANSSWCQSFRFSNPKQNHFVYSFHDSTFECIAETWSASQVAGPISNALRLSLNSID